MQYAWQKKHVTNLLSSVKSHCHEEFHGQKGLQIKTSPHLIGGKKYVGNEIVTVQILNSWFSDLKAALFLFFHKSSRFAGYCGCQKFDLLSNQYQCARNQVSRHTTEKQEKQNRPNKTAAACKNLWKKASHARMPHLTPILTCPQRVTSMSSRSNQADLHKV